MGSQRSHVLLQAQSRHRSLLGEECERSARNSEVGAREWSSRICACLQRFRDGPGHGVEQSVAGIDGKVQDPVRSVRGSGALRRYITAPEETRYPDHWRRCSAELVAAVWSFLRVAPPAFGRKRRVEALSLWTAHLSRAGLLGWVIRQSLSRSH